MIRPIRIDIRIDTFVDHRKSSDQVGGLEFATSEEGKVECDLDAESVKKVCDEGRRRGQESIQSLGIREEKTPEIIRLLPRLNRPARVGKQIEEGICVDEGKLGGRIEDVDLGV